MQLLFWATFTLGKEVEGVDLRKWMNVRSPVGWAAAVALILAFSPRARKAARRMAVKGTATALNMAEQVKETAIGMQQQVKSWMKRDSMESEEVSDSTWEEVGKQAPAGGELPLEGFEDLLQSLMKRLEKQQQELEALRHQMENNQKPDDSGT
ncbi:hypothetical protein JQC72_10755 [Polycladomyces sp. WAk]|uniref:Uncharacterized protein n=1 Tax=Polycladomyces zharkentensis TaxID=2807616 RepID=A0ABS2WKE6_9BACL|nr:hypothetical protein [Polycladomyces sp. WAk]MBN2909994.1 hypothetical protein [Polycladomyces sp. WAk]